MNAKCEKQKEKATIKKSAFIILNIIWKLIYNETSWDFFLYDEILKGKDAIFHCEKLKYD